MVQYVGNMIAPRTAPLKSMLRLVWGRAGFPPNTKLLIFEEVKYVDELMIMPVNLDRPLHVEQIDNGDIIIVQEDLEVNCWRRWGLSGGL